MRFLALLLFIAPFSPAASDRETLENLTARWLALRAERAAERDAWRDEEARLRLEQKLIEGTAQSLEAERKKLRDLESDAQVRQSALVEETQAIREAIARVNREAETHQAALAKTHVAPSDASATPRSLLAHAQSRLQQQTRIHTGSLMIDTPEGRREMEVLWIGTARGYAVGQQGPARLGVPGPSGWTWTEIPASTEAVRRALRIAKGESVPALVDLPMGEVP